MILPAESPGQGAGIPGGYGQHTRNKTSCSAREGPLQTLLWRGLPLLPQLMPNRPPAQDVSARHPAAVLGQGQGSRLLAEPVRNPPVCPVVLPLSESHESHPASPGYCGRPALHVRASAPSQPKARQLKFSPQHRCPDNTIPRTFLPGGWHEVSRLPGPLRSPGVVPCWTLCSTIPVC